MFLLLRCIKPALLFYLKTHVRLFNAICQKTKKPLQLKQRFYWKAYLSVRPISIKTWDRTTHAQYSRYSIERKLYDSLIDQYLSLKIHCLSRSVAWKINQVILLLGTNYITIEMYSLSTNRTNKRCTAMEKAGSLLLYKMR